MRTFFGIVEMISLFIRIKKLERPFHAYARLLKAKKVNKQKIIRKIYITLPFKSQVNKEKKKSRQLHLSFGLEDLSFGRRGTK
jgi:hypothetical protein